MEYWVYILRCADGSLYTGAAADIDRRAAVHNSGRGAKYTAPACRVEVVYREACPDKRGGPPAGIRHQGSCAGGTSWRLSQIIKESWDLFMKKAAFIGAGNMGGAPHSGGLPGHWPRPGGHYRP